MKIKRDLKLESRFQDLRRRIQRDAEVRVDLLWFPPWGTLGTRRSLRTWIAFFTLLTSRAGRALKAWIPSIPFWTRRSLGAWDRGSRLKCSTAPLQGVNTLL